MVNKKFAYVLFHYGNSIKDLELEIYLLLYLKKITNHDLIYFYSISDTPSDYITTIFPLVTQAIGYTDIITANNQFRTNKKYDNYDIFRRCNYIHAYQLIDYNKVCIIENNLLPMGSMDSIFKLNAPAIQCHTIAPTQVNHNVRPSSAATIREDEMDGGVLLLQPNINTYKKCLELLSPEFFDKNKEYAREHLFKISEPNFYNLPIKYNFSHLFLKHISQYPIKIEDVLAFHFNNTRYDHLTIIKDNWKELRELNEKRVPVMHYKENVYSAYKLVANSYLSNISSKYVALLFLTEEGTIPFKPKYAEYFDNCNIYTYSHPHKNKYLLLEKAFANKNNQYFILLSGDTYPLYGVNQMFIYLNLLKERSVLSESSPFCCITRKDANTILTYYHEYVKSPNTSFLSLLTHYVKNYNYINSEFVYFENGIGEVSPVIFQKILYTDIEKLGNSFFIRKSSPHFRPNTYFPSDSVNIVVIGKDTNQSQLLNKLRPLAINRGQDVIIVSRIDYTKIHPDLAKLSVKIYPLKGAMSRDHIVAFFTRMFHSLKIYHTIYFIEGEKEYYTHTNTMAKIREMPMIRRPLKYIHITKTGGSSIEELGEVYQLNWGKYDMDIKRAVQHVDATHGAFWHVPTKFFNPHELKQIMRDNDLFASVRNPYTRVASEYYYKYSGPQIKAKTAGEFNKWIQNRLLKVKKEMASRSPINGHWVPQYLYILDSNNKVVIPPERIIHMENMNSEFNKLMYQYGIPLDIANLDKQNESSKKLFNEYDLSNENIRLINEIYKLDFSYFGYIMVGEPMVPRHEFLDKV